MKTYIYHGPSGYNPDLGLVANGQERMLSDKEFGKFKKYFSEKREEKPKKKSKQEKGD